MSEMAKVARKVLALNIIGYLKVYLKGYNLKIPAAHSPIQKNSHLNTKIECELKKLLTIERIAEYSKDGEKRKKVPLQI